MAMPQRDDLIEEMKRTDLLLEWAVMHGEKARRPRRSGGNFDIIRAMSSFIQSLTPTLFWDVDRETIDEEKHRRFVIERVLERGGMRDWRFALAHYGLDKIVGEAQQMRSLSPKTLAFVACVGGVEKETFRCYSLQPLHRKHWAY